MILFLLLDKHEQRNPPTEDTPTEESLLDFKESTGSLLVGSKDEKDPTIDTDNDGLEDWEETLWGTNPFLEDTDNDGISDLIEVTKQQEATSRELDEIGFPAEEEDLNDTDIIARQLYIAATSIPEGEGLPPASVELLSEIVAEQVLDSIPQETTLLDDLHVVIDTPTTRSDYLQPLYELLSAYILEQSEVATLNTFILSLESPQSITRISAHKNEQERFIQGLQIMTIPQPYADIHLSLINATENYRDILLALVNTGNNPLTAYGAIYQYQNAVENIWNTYKEFDEVITNTQN
jgi:hypothetical protein